jgi:transcriptional regulator with XRE-family HTH domain
MTDDDTVGKRILDCRTAKDISQSRLAQLIGVSPAAISHWETGGTVPRPRNLSKIADALQVSLDYFLSGKPSGNQSGDQGNRAADASDGPAAVETATSVAQQVEKLKMTIAKMSGVDVARIRVEIKIAS